MAGPPTHRYAKQCIRSRHRPHHPNGDMPSTGPLSDFLGNLFLRRRAELRRPLVCGFLGPVLRWRVALRAHTAPPYARQSDLLHECGETRVVADVVEQWIEGEIHETGIMQFK